MRVNLCALAGGIAVLAFVPSVQALPPWPNGLRLGPRYAPPAYSPTYNIPRGNGVYSYLGYGPQPTITAASLTTSSQIAPSSATSSKDLIGVAGPAGGNSASSSTFVTGVTTASVFNGSSNGLSAVHFTAYSSVTASPFGLDTFGTSTSTPVSSQSSSSLSSATSPISLDTSSSLALVSAVALVSSSVSIPSTGDTLSTAIGSLATLPTGTFHGVIYGPPPSSTSVIDITSSTGTLYPSFIGDPTHFISSSSSLVNTASIYSFGATTAASSETTVLASQGSQLSSSSSSLANAASIYSSGVTSAASSETTALSSQGSELSSSFNSLSSTSPSDTGSTSTITVKITSQISYYQTSVAPTSTALSGLPLSSSPSVPYPLSNGTFSVAPAGTGTAGATSTTSVTTSGNTSSITGPTINDTYSVNPFSTGLSNSSQTLPSGYSTAGGISASTAKPFGTAVSSSSPGLPTASVPYPLFNSTSTLGQFGTGSSYGTALPTASLQTFPGSLNSTVQTSTLTSYSIKVLSGTGGSDPGQTARASGSSSINPYFPMANVTSSTNPSGFLYPSGSVTGIPSSITSFPHFTTGNSSSNYTIVSTPTTESNLTTSQPIYPAGNSTALPIGTAITTSSPIPTNASFTTGTQSIAPATYYSAGNLSSTFGTAGPTAPPTPQSSLTATRSHNISHFPATRNSTSLRGPSPTNSSSTGFIISPYPSGYASTGYGGPISSTSLGPYGNVTSTNITASISFAASTTGSNSSQFTAASSVEGISVTPTTYPSPNSTVPVGFSSAANSTSLSIIYLGTGISTSEGTLRTVFTSPTPTTLASNGSLSTATPLSNSSSPGSTVYSTSLPASLISGNSSLSTALSSNSTNVPVFVTSTTAITSATTSDSDFIRSSTTSSSTTLSSTALSSAASSSATSSSAASSSATSSSTVSGPTTSSSATSSSTTSSSAASSSTGLSNTLTTSLDTSSSETNGSSSSDTTKIGPESYYQPHHGDHRKHRPQYYNNYEKYKHHKDYEHHKEHEYEDHEYENEEYEENDFHREYEYHDDGSRYGGDDDYAEDYREGSHHD